MNNRSNLACKSFSPGYTLLEILLVLAIGSILLTVVPPLFSKSERIIIKQTAEKIAHTIYKARIDAITHNSIRKINIDIHTKTILFEDSDYSPFALPESIEFEVKTVAEYVDPDEVSIYFYPDGSSSGAILILQSDRYTYEVTVNWLTGNTSVARVQV